MFNPPKKGTVMWYVDRITLILVIVAVAVFLYLNPQVVDDLINGRI